MKSGEEQDKSGKGKEDGEGGLGLIHDKGYFGKEYNVRGSGGIIWI